MRYAYRAYIMYKAGERVKKQGGLNGYYRQAFNAARIKGTVDGMMEAKELSDL